MMLETGAVSGWTQAAILTIVGFALLAGVIAMGVAVSYRWTTRHSIPPGTAVLVGWTFPALLLTLDALRHGVLLEPAPLVGYASGVLILGVFATGTATSVGGWWLGDHLARRVAENSPPEQDALVPTRRGPDGAWVALTLPDRIDDVHDSCPVDPETRDALSGKRVLLPRRLDDRARERRLESRLQADFDLDHVECDLDSEGTVTRLAVGRAPTGCSHAIPPGLVALSMQATYASSSGAGSPVEVWTTGGEEPRLAGVGTIHIQSQDWLTILFEPETARGVALEADHCRITTVSAPRNDRQALLSALRRSSVCVERYRVTDADALAGEFVEWLPGRVLAIQRPGEEPLAFPAGNEPVEPGDTVYVLEQPADQARDPHSSDDQTTRPAEVR